MSYSESAEFTEKKNVISELKNALLRNKIEINFSKSFILDIGGAGGVLGGLLSLESRRVYVSDIIDHQDKYDGEFPKLLKQKFDRNHLKLNLSRLEFHTADAMELPYKDNLFDLVVSLNAFEHIPEPEQALLEAIRVTKKGGVVYITFDPVWTADTGGHFHHYVNEPWAHLLLSTEEYRLKMIAAGADQKYVDEFPNAMNRKTSSFYRDILPEVVQNCGVERFYFNSWSGCVVESYLNHNNMLKASLLLNIPREDLLIRGFSIVIKK